MKKDRLGEEFVTNEGYTVKIIEYNSSLDCTVKFLINGLELKNIEYSRIQKGRIKNLFHPRVLNKGFIGQGDFKSEVNGKAIKEYYIWRGMLTRCYCEKYHILKPTYKDCTVVEEWYNFQNFAKWFEDNYIEGFELDKDILVKGNKVYSPETCCFVPKEVNILFTKGNKNRGLYPIGVNFNNYKQKYEANLNKKGVLHYLGVFDKPEEAFQVYKEEKEKYIKEVADKWRDQIDPRVYEAMYNYQVEITD